MDDTKTIPIVIEKIRHLYEIASKAELVERVEGGYLSQNFILKNGSNKLFLKQYRFDDIEKIKTIHRVKFFFAAGGVPVILPIKSNNNESFFESNGKFYALFPFVQGKIIKRVERSREAFGSAGEMLATIHALTKDKLPDIVQEHVKGWDKEEFLNEAKRIRQKIEEKSEKTEFDKLALNVLCRKTKLVTKNDLQYEELNLQNNHIIHGDYHGQNIFFDDNEQVRYVFDIEKTELSPRVLEIARSVDFMCFSNHYEKKNFEDANVFLSFYNKTYPLDKDELVRGIKAYYIKKTHSLWIEKEHYINNNMRVDCFLEGELLMLNYYSQNFDKLITELNFTN